MRWNKLTALPLFFLPVLFLINSCKPEDLAAPPNTYSKRDIVMSGAQEIPANPSTARGLLNVSYNKVTKILTYDITWSGLSGAATAAHIHGPAPTGFPAAVIQGFSGLAAAASGSFSGILVADGAKVKEEDILNGLYYVNIHTASYPGGEIRGQIRFY